MYQNVRIIPIQRQVSLETMSSIVREIRQTLEGNPALARLHLDRLSAALKLNLSRDSIEDALLAARPPLPAGPARRGLADWQLRRVTEHIEQHLDTPITSDALAGSINVSTGHFFRAFKAAVGETPHHYVIRQRLRRAQILMLETDDPLSNIASACGLTDQAHLTRLFRRFIGTTPLAWRRKWHCLGDDRRPNN